MNMNKKIYEEKKTLSNRYFELNSMYAQQSHKISITIK